MLPVSQNDNTPMPIVPVVPLKPLDITSIRHGYTVPSCRSRTVNPKRNGLMAMHVPVPGLSTKLARTLMANNQRKHTPHDERATLPPIVHVPTPVPVPHEPATRPTRLFAATTYTPKGELLCVQGHVYLGNTVSRPLKILIDTGFTGNILLNDKLARRLKLKSAPSHCPIRLANGTTITSAHMIPDLFLSLSPDHAEQHDTLLFPLESYDAVVGMQWLRTNQAYINCANLTLSFYHQGQWLELHCTALT